MDFGGYCRPRDRSLAATIRSMSEMAMLQQLS
jgi:hypothetical protein